MPDVIDEIINKLSSSTIQKLLQYTSESEIESVNLENSINQIHEIKVKQINKEFKRKTLDLKSKTAENRNYLIKIRNDLESMKTSKNSESRQLNIKAYENKINELENQIKYLTKNFKSVDLEKLFTDTEDLNSKLQDFKMKINEAKSKYQCFEGFPPDIKQAQIEITKIKERIKNSDLQIDERFYTG